MQRGVALLVATQVTQNRHIVEVAILHSKLQAYHMMITLLISILHMLFNMPMQMGLTK